MGDGENPPARPKLSASLSGYGWAIGATSLAAIARWLLPGALAPAPYLGFYPAVVVAAALGGVWPGLAATFGALFLVNFVFGHFDIADSGGLARQVIWVAASIGVSLLAGMQRQARMREREQAAELRRWNDELEARVEQRTTEISEANILLRDANQKLAKLDQAKTNFFSNISHEFRTPLTLILGSLEETLGNAASALSPGQSATLAAAHRNSFRLLKLVNALLEFTRLEAGRVKGAFHPLDLARATAQSASLFESAFVEAGLAFTIDCKPLREPVYADPEMWDKIVLNLLSNAFKFTHSGGVTLSLQGHAGGACLTVRDTGIGMPEEELPNLFQRFHRIEGSEGRSHEGSGIGLALVKELVDLHGGAISVESAEGRGSAFHVSIPFGKSHLPADRVKEAPVPDHSGLRAEPYIVEARSWLPSPREDIRDEESLDSESARAATNAMPRVVLADDNADMRDYMGRLLSRAGFEVITVSNGEKALASCLADPPDLVLTDVMMPKLDGFGLVAKLRSHERTALLPIILLSARAGEDARVEGLKSGADDYLVKPFGARELLARADTAVRLAHARKEAMSREAEIARLRASFESAAVGMAHAATDGRWLRVNDRLCVMTGYTREELLGKTFQEITHPADLETDLADMHQLLTGLIANYTIEKRYIRKNGGIIWVNLTVSLVRKADGSTDYFVSVIDDITARKQAAIELAESRVRLSGVVDSAMDAIISIDSQQNVVLFNAAAERMFRRKAAHVIGRPLGQLLPPRFIKGHARHVEAFAKTGVSNRAMGNLGALSALRADGSEFPIEASISQTSIAGEKLFTAIIRDITERKRAEDMQRLLLAELDHRVKNTLATVQAIAMQTLNAKMRPAAFVEAFSGRIQALGRAHGLLSRSGWQGADLAMLVNEQLMPDIFESDGRISASGPDIMLEPQAALHLGLVLHELGSNARKHGCLSYPEGRLATEWSVNENSGHSMLRLRWSESDGPPVAAPQKRGFGTVLIERSLRYALGGEARLDFAPGGVTCDISLPLVKAGQGAYSGKPSESAL